jgi:hypothetical protein
LAVARKLSEDLANVTARIVARACQSASNFDPLSACNVDPL